MIDWLRSLANRPIQEHERVRAFGIAVAIVLAVAALLYVTRPADTDDVAATTTTATTPVRPVPIPVEPQQTVTQAPPGTPEANAPYAPPAAAERAMRQFLDGYLAYLYGRGSARSIDRASAQLIGRLAANPPRVSPAQRERSPKIVEVRSRRPQPGRVRLIATIDAGETSQYPIGALLRVRNGQWQVTEILNDD